MKYALLVAIELVCFNNHAFAARQFSQEVLGEIYQSGEFCIEKDPLTAKE
ncbi:hypothetical protein [Commensalibacter nepenthis]|uniref:Uncharacterized protein n=1 Tax=Commensalibacter nepenthis TaxID=3043872 RepID=A0ABT6Q6Q3_9PROT|nr:hypothetical protein [Commensalibacter sp. TBRC 10068]MDI2112571.1 hypothetical protein [Commensalibacter sp. TBRC 10068]